MSALTLTALCASTAVDVDQAVETVVVEPIRLIDHDLEVVTSEGRHSPTFVGLVVRIGDLRGIVYVGWTAILPSGVQAALLHRASRTPDGTRCLWIVILRSRVSEALVPILAHELQHAIEVLESPAMTSADIETTFKRRGNLGAGPVYETVAAVRVQQQVEAELRAARHSRK